MGAPFIHHENLPMNRPKRLPLILLAVLAAAVAIFAAYAWITLQVSYAEGERAGYLQKFSRKGWICKTWEGEILLTSMPGAIPERFEFSVRDDLVAKQLMAAMGKRVNLTYSQHKGVPSACFGETEYFIEKVTLQQ
jgi:hypothetical protein